MVGTRESAEEAADAVGWIERRGIGFIPESARHARPRDMGFVFFGTQMTYGSVVIGALPVAFGLGWRGALTSILAGTVIGALLVAAMAVMGPRAGTNGTVTSGAFFGIRGRYVGSFITQVIDLGYFAMQLWISAPPLVQTGHLLLGLPMGTGMLTGALLLFALVVLAFGIFGHATLVAGERFVAWSGLLGLLVLTGFCLPHVTARSHPLVLGGWWPSWILAVTVTIANAISYAPFAGDYARYIPTATPSRSVFHWPFWGMVLGCLIACGCGAVIGLSVSDPFDPTSQMLLHLPLALILPVVIVGFIGNAANGGMVVYNGMLDLQAVLWRLLRVQVGIIFSGVGLVLAYLGLIVFNAANAILALCSIVTVLVTPWTIINVIGYLRHGRRFAVTDLQAFGSRGPRGLYWYAGGFNPAAILSWLVAIIVGLLFSDTALYAGPLAHLAHGVDLSFLSAALVGGLLYWLLDRRAVGLFR